MDMKKILKDESGIALITALLVMILITVLGTAAIMTSTTDVKIGANFRNYNRSFYSAEGAVNLVPNLLGRAFDILETNPSATAFTLQSDIDMMTTDPIITGVNLMTELQSSTPLIGDISTTTDNDLSTTVGDSTIVIDVDYVSVRRLAGGSTESQSRYEGIGAGGSAFANQYRIHGEASSNTGNSQAKVQILYQRIQK